MTRGAAASERGRLIEGQDMTADKEREFHMERAAQCRQMADEASDPSVRRLHEQLAEFHEAEANREVREFATHENEI